MLYPDGNHRNPTKHDRNAEIIKLVGMRVPYRAIAKKFDISVGRVGQIMKRHYERSMADLMEDEYGNSNFLED